MPLAQIKKKILTPCIPDEISNLNSNNLGILTSISSVLFVDFPNDAMIKTNTCDFDVRLFL